MTQPDQIRALNERLAAAEEAGPADVLADAIDLLREAATLYDARDQPESAALLRRLSRELTPADGAAPAVSAGVAPATDQSTLRDRIRALALLEAAEWYAQQDKTVLAASQVAADLRRRADEADPMPGSLARDGFGLDEIAAMLTGPVLPATVDRADDDLATARATNQRLNLRAQKLESELAAYRRAVSQWDVSERGTYVPLRTIAAIAKAAGRDIETPQWLLHYQRVEQAEAAVERVRSVLESEAVVGRSALDYRGLIVSALMADAATGLRRLAAEARTTEQDAPREPVQHTPGTAILCPDCRAKGHAVCVDAEARQDPTPDSETPLGSAPDEYDDWGTAPCPVPLGEAQAKLNQVRSLAAAWSRPSMIEPVRVAGAHLLRLLEAPSPNGEARTTEPTETEAHEPEYRWRVEILDGVTWIGDSRGYGARSIAVERYQAASHNAPAWADGQPVQRRLVRETTSYTVEPTTPPAGGAPQTTED
jgi:hypothetical protein